MVTTPYSGQTVRSASPHYDYRPPPPGLDPDHFTGEVEPDIFNPVPDQPTGQQGTVWTDVDNSAGHSGYRSLAEIPVHHWYDGLPPVRNGVPYEVAQQEMQNRLMVDHSPVNYEHDGIRFYQHASEGTQIDWVDGRMPQYAGQTLDGPLAALANGKNAYDQTNTPNEVYAGDSANVGRYRLGKKAVMFGKYTYPIGKFGQDALLRAYSGLTPQFPANKRQWMDVAAPYTPNSSGANGFWAPAPSNQAPSNFALPSETAITDYGVAAQTDATSTEFEDRGWF